MTGYKWYGRNRDDGKRASGGVAMMVHKCVELRVCQERG